MEGGQEFAGGGGEGGEGGGKGGEDGDQESEGEGAGGYEGVTVYAIPTWARHGKLSSHAPELYWQLPTRWR